MRKTLGSDAEKNKRSHIQCYECKGFGHLKTECPTVRRREMKCFGCKGLGHTQMECVNDQKRRKEKSMLEIDDDESEEEIDEEEDLSNLVAFLGVTDFVDGIESSDSESDAEDGTVDDAEEELRSSYKMMRETLIKINGENVDLQKEKAELLKEKARLEATVESLQTELQTERKLAHDSVKLIKEKLTLAIKAEKLEKDLEMVVTEARAYKSELDQQQKTVKMLTGTKQLDKILTIGRTEWVNRGLGYTGGRNSTEKINFVSAGVQDLNQEEKPKVMRQQTQQRVMTQRAPQATTRRMTRSITQRKKRCYYCGKVGHIQTDCFRFQNRVEKLRREGRYSQDRHYKNRFWVKKADLYQSQAQPRGPRGFQVCRMAYLTELDEDEPWYFDSGCSRHMTGSSVNLEEVERLRGGVVTFGDGNQCAIKGKGVTRDHKLPQLMNVFAVDGLKANLISVSQLCDDGLTVMFTKGYCKAVDAKGKVILSGVRSENDCYMWQKSPRCLQARDDLNLRHQKIGHMTVGKQVQ